MIENLRTWVGGHRDEMQAFLRRCFAEERPLLLQTDLRGIFAGLAELGLDAGPGTPLDRVVRLLQEAVLQAPWACFAVREEAGSWHYLRAHLDDVVPETIDVVQYLRFKEGLVRPDLGGDPVLEVDFAPFNREFPRLKENRSIGQGVHFLNRHLAAAMFQRTGGGHARLLNFLRLHALEGQQLMLYEHIGDVASLRTALRHAQQMLERHAPSACGPRRRAPRAA